MASLTPAVVMAGVAIVAALIVIGAGAFLGRPDLARPVFGGLIGPLAAAVATWILTVRTSFRDPAGLTRMMVAAFFAKLVFFALYVVVMIKVADLPVQAFGLSFVAFFVGLYAIEAAFFARLFNGRALETR